MWYELKFLTQSIYFQTFKENIIAHVGPNNVSQVFQKPQVKSVFYAGVLVNLWKRIFFSV